MSFLSNRRPPPAASGGFTLMEMIVVIAIFGIVTSVILANLPTFRDRSSLDLVAQEVAINIRGAQVFGGSGRVGVTAGRPTYGINFDPADFRGPGPHFFLFRDHDNDNEFDVQCQNQNQLCEQEAAYTLSRGFFIDSVCYNGSVCGEAINILFTRPNLEPRFAVGGNLFPGVNYVSIRVKSSRSGEAREVVIWSNGQIAVVNPNNSSN